MIGILTLFALIGFPLSLIPSVPNAEFSEPIIPAILIIIYTSISLTYISFSPNRQFLRLFFYIYSYFFLGICTFLQVLADTFPWSGNPDDVTCVRAEFIILIGLIAFDVGSKAAMSKKLEPTNFFKRHFDDNKIIIMGFISLLLAALYVKIYVGDVGNLFVSREERGLISSEAMGDQTTGAVIYGLCDMATYAVFMVMFAQWLRWRKEKLIVSVAWQLLLFLLFMVTIILNNPISTARLRFGSIALGIYSLLPWRSWSNALIIFVMVFGLAIVFPIADLFRTTLDTNLSERLDHSSIATELIEKGDFDSFLMIANTMLVTDKEGLRAGRQMLGTIFFWIPRNIWINKPWATGQWIAEEMGYLFTNLSSPLWAEFYVDGGWIAVILGFIAYGYMASTFDRWNHEFENENKVQLLSVLVPLFASYQFFFLRGALMPAVAYFMPMVVVVLLCSKKFQHN